MSVAIAQPIVDPDVKVNDSKGRDGNDTSPICCWDPDPTEPPCVGVEWDKCCFNREKACNGGENHTDTCTDGMDCPGGVCVPCDDEPKRQNEMAIAVAPWDPNTLVATWQDGSKDFVGAQQLTMMGVAISDDAGLTWKRFDPALDPCNLSCDPSSDCFVVGSSLVLDDFCSIPGTSQGDPAAAASEGDPLDPNRKQYLFLAGVDFLATAQDPLRAMFSRLEWSNGTAGWENAIVAGLGDKTFVTADRAGKDVYLYHSGVRLSGG